MRPQANQAQDKVMVTLLMCLLNIPNDNSPWQPRIDLQIQVKARFDFCTQHIQLNRVIPMYVGQQSGTNQITKNTGHSRVYSSASWSMYRSHRSVSQCVYTSMWEWSTVPMTHDTLVTHLTHCTCAIVMVCVFSDFRLHGVTYAFNKVTAIVLSWCCRNVKQELHHVCVRVCVCPHPQVSFAKSCN